MINKCCYKKNFQGPSLVLCFLLAERPMLANRLFWKIMRVTGRQMDKSVLMVNNLNNCILCNAQYDSNVHSLMQHRSIVWCGLMQHRSIGWTSPTSSSSWRWTLARWSPSSSRYSTSSLGRSASSPSSASPRQNRLQKVITLHKMAWNRLRSFDFKISFFVVGTMYTID